jgi:hypothetical protein
VDCEETTHGQVLMIHDLTCFCGILGKSCGAASSCLGLRYLFSGLHVWVSLHSGLLLGMVLTYCIDVLGQHWSLLEVFLVQRDDKVLDGRDV